MTQDPDLIAYVRAAAAVLQLPLDDERVRRVATHLARTAAMAQSLEGQALAPEAEPVGIYQAAPYPAGPAGGGR